LILAQQKIEPPMERGWRTAAVAVVSECIICGCFFLLFLLFVASALFVELHHY
jgi:hypothetical protein